MSRQYYTLVAGLKEYTLDSEKREFDAPAIIAGIKGELSKTDKGYLELFYNFYDIENIIHILNGRSYFSELGNYSREQMEEQVKNPSELPRYLATVLSVYTDSDNTDYEEVDHDKAIEKALFEAYYAKCALSGNRFIRRWYEFDRNMRNVLAAYAARKAGIPVAGELVGSGHLTDALGRSSGADSVPKGESEYLDEVASILGEENNMLEKERKLDRIRWNASDELTTFDYFNMNRVLSCLVKINLVHRWISLDPKYGREIFEKLAASFDGGNMIKEAEERNKI